MKKSVALLLFVFFAFSPERHPSPVGATTANSVRNLLGKLEWRSIGPFLGGRVVAVAGVPSDPDLFYFGGVQGGIWRSTDDGNQWVNISDGKIPGTAQTIGAIAVAPSNPKVIYAGSGEADIRGDFDTGDGIYKTIDAGKTWQYAGLRETHTTAGLAIDPKDSDIVYAASMGHVFKGNAERGVYKTTDGGKNWKRVLYIDEHTGAIDLRMDPTDSRVLYAAMWQAKREPWKLTSGGPGSGLYKTIDAGAHWIAISKRPGFARGLLGRMGVGIAPSDPRIVYAIVQAREGGVFRSSDGGATWKRVNAQMKLRQRAFYYMTVFVDPKNAMVAYAPEVDDVWKTTDGGLTWKTFFAPGVGHGDYHTMWIDPRDPRILLEGDDGGAVVSVDGGKSWSSYLNQATGQYYHVALDKQFPYHVYGAAQDEGSFEGPSATAKGYIAWGDWQTVASGESTFVAPEPGNAAVTYGAGYHSVLIRQNNDEDQGHDISPWPTYLTGSSPAEQRYRFSWTHPVIFSPANDKELLETAQVVFSSSDRGRTWKTLSPDLTRDEKSTEGPSGGPIDFDQTGAETFPDIASLAVSPLDGDVIWAGSSDGLVHVTQNHGGDWKLVTPPDLPQWAQISSIEASRTATGTAYLTASRYMWDDFHPYVYKTNDFGAHWQPIAAGIPADQYVFTVREDPRLPQLLFAGTRSTVYVSFDGGERWGPLTLNLPGVQIRDLALDARQGQVVAATHGRAFWILDDLALIEQVAQLSAPGAGQPLLFAPETAWLTHAYGTPPDAAPPATGKNPDYGATVFFKLPSSYDGKTAATLSFVDVSGATVRSFDLHLKSKNAKKTPKYLRYEMNASELNALDLADATAAQPGMNSFQWDLRLPRATEVDGYKEATANDFSESVDGPTIVPGTYTVVLQYGATKLTQPLELKLDPRLQATPDDLAARFALETHIHDTLDRLDRAINAAISAEPKVSPSRRPALESAIGELVWRGIHSSEGDELHESKLRTHLAFLANELELAYERPTEAEYASADELQAEAAAGIGRLHGLLAVAFEPRRNENTVPRRSVPPAVVVP